MVWGQAQCPREALLPPVVSNVRGDGRVWGGRGGNGNGDGGKGKGREWRKKGMNVLGISEFLPLPCSAASPFTHTHTLALTLTHYDIVIHLHTPAAPEDACKEYWCDSGQLILGSLPHKRSLHGGQACHSGGYGCQNCKVLYAAVVT